MTTILFVLLVTLASGALIYGVLEPRFQNEKTARSRLDQFSASSDDVALRQAARDRMQEVAKRRKTLQSTLDELDSRNKERDRSARKLTLEKRIHQAGLKIGARSFVIGSVGAGVFAFLLSAVLQSSLLMALGIGIVTGFGLPRWFLARARKRRQTKFTEEFANAIDVIVRGIKSGLPLNDTLRVIASDTPEPVRSEFARVVEALQVGSSLQDAVNRLHTNMPLPETNFFAIVIAIQAQSGGNLAEALGNLSRVLRDRKKMKGKIKAMSMEAKASAAIIGALPPIVAGLVYLTSPDYISILFTDPTGHMILAASAFWMGMGIMIMRKMINFDF